MQDGELFELLEATADAAFAVAEEGRILFWNSAAEKLFGYTAAQALDHTCYELLRGRGTLGDQICHAHCDPWRCSARGEAVPSFDLEVTLRSGDRRWVNISNLFLRRQRGDALMIHLARDISSQKSQERLVRQMRELSRQFTSLGREEAEGSPPAGLAPGGPIGLSPRQREILRHFAAGEDSAEVAERLGITTQSLRNHVHRINQALHTHTRTAAVLQAQRRQLI